MKGIAAAMMGVDALPVTVEATMSPSFDGGGTYIIGLPDSSVKESLFRCDAAIRNSGLEPIRQRLVINLSPGDVRKEGSSYDLGIALVMLRASYQLGDAEKLDTFLVMGELGLDGKILPVKGVLPAAILARKLKLKGMLVPIENAKEAAIVKDLEVYGVHQLADAVAWIRDEKELKRVIVDPRADFEIASEEFDVDFADVKGQESVKRAFEIAAAGGHNLVMIGSPGSGKTMLAKRMPSILPPMTLHEALETTKIHSVAGKLSKDAGLVARRPFRNPHHTISDIALIGGGVFPHPGEVSLAQNGVLFLDELPEFNRSVLETMRQPLEDHKVVLNRAKYQAEFPAQFMLLASMNPCMCGYYQHPTKPCTCSPGNITKYMGKVSGPLMDRIDLHVEVAPVDYDVLGTVRKGETSAQIRERVVKAREFQQARYEKDGVQGVFCNAQLDSGLLQRYCVLPPTAALLLKAAMQKLGLSARAYDRILRVARTIADLAGSEDIAMEHVAEAIHYRSLDKQV